jgi:MFS family permease
MLITLTGFLSGFSQNYLWLLILRGLVGFGLGSSSVPFDLLAEFLPPCYRGVFLIYIEYFWTIGSVIVAASAWLLLPRYNWRVLTTITAIPVALSCLGSIPLLPESPRWLLAKGRVREAEDVVTAAAAINGTALSQLDFKSSGLLFRHAQTEMLSPSESVSNCLSCSDLKLFVPLCLIWCCFGMSYYSTIMFTGEVAEKSNSRVDDDGPTCSFNYPSMFYSALSELVGCTIVALVIDKWGRVGTQAALYMTGAAGAICMGVAAPASPNQTLIVILSAVARLGVFSASACTWVHTPELFRTEVRATGHAAANAMSQIGAAIGPFIVYNLPSDFAIGLSIAIANTLCVICVLLLPETMGMIGVLLAIILSCDNF